jgi:hypothetical protein
MNDLAGRKRWGSAMRSSSLLEIALITMVGIVLLWMTPKALWRPYIIPDSTEVYYGTRNLVERGDYRITVNGALHPPRYSYGYSAFLLAPAYRITGRPRAMFVVPTLCGIANMVLMYWLTRRLFGPGIAVIAALLVPVLPAYYLSSWDLLSHVPSLTLFLLIALLAPWQFARSWRGVLAALGIGVLGGVAFTIRPTSVAFFAPPLVMLLVRFTPLRREFWVRGAAMLVGATPFVLPLLWSNFQTFGNITRTGYSYWCALIYDVPGRSFRFDLATLRDGLRFYAIPVGLELNLGGISALPFLVVVAVAGQVIIGLIRARRGVLLHRYYALFALTTLVTFLCLYLPYTFRFHWFMYPVYACLLPFLACGLGSLWQGFDFGPKAEQRRVVGLFLILLLCLVKRWYLPHGAADPRRQTGQQFSKLRHLLPDDAIFISSRDPLSVHEELVRGTGRVFVPLNRASEYTWTQITPRPPAARTVEAIAAASRPVYPLVFEEEPATFLRRYSGRRVFLETPGPAGYGGALPPGFDLVPIEASATLALYEVEPRAAKDTDAPRTAATPATSSRSR